MKKIILFFAFAFIGLNAFSQMFEYATHWVDSTRTLAVTYRWDIKDVRATITPSDENVAWDPIGQAFIINPQKNGGMVVFKMKTSLSGFHPVFQWCNCTSSTVDQTPPVPPYEYSRALNMINSSGTQMSFGESMLEPYLRFNGMGGDEYTLIARWTNGWRECRKVRLALILIPFKM